MRERIAAMNWKNELQYSGPSRVKFNHDRFKYRLVTFIEQRILGGHQLGGFRNYVLLKPPKVAGL